MSNVAPLSESSQAESLTPVGSTCFTHTNYGGEMGKKTVLCFGVRLREKTGAVAPSVGAVSGGQGATLTAVRWR